MNGASMSHLLEKAQQQTDKGTRSVLDPHYEVIATLRKKHWTFREIAEFFKEEGIQISVTWLTQYWALKNGASKKSSSRKKSSTSIPNDPTLAQSELTRAENKTNLPTPASVPEVKKKLFEFNGFDQSDWEEFHRLRAGKKNV